MPVPGISPVSLFMPGMAETQVGLSNIDRQRALAQALQQQSLEPIQAGASQGPLGPVTAPISWTQTLAKLGQGYVGGQIQHGLDEKQLALIKGLSGQYSGLFGSGGTPAPSASSPEVQSALSAGGGPTVANAQTLEQSAPPMQGVNGPLQMPGMSSAQSQLLYSTSPDEYTKALIRKLQGPDVNKITDALGISRGSPEYKAILQKSLTKETHVPLDTLRQNGIALDENGNVKAFNPPPIPGAFPQFQGGMPTGYAQAPGAQGIMAGNAAAQSGGQAYGKLPYEPPTVYNTPGAPTAATPTQAITAATGAPIPPPLGMGQQQGAPPANMRYSPADTAAQGSKQLDVLQQEATRQLQMNGIVDPELKQEIANAQTRSRGQYPQGKPPLAGITLQDQGESAQQKSFGTQRGQLAAEMPVATVALNDASSNLDRLSNLAIEVANHPGLPRTTGLMGAIPNIPGSQAADAAAKLDTIKSQTAFSVLQAMRNASKSGGALGQVSDREEEMLANNLAALQKAQSPEAIKDNLLRISAWAAGAKSRMQNAYDMTYKGAAPLAPAGGQTASGQISATSITPQAIIDEIRRRGLAK